MLTRLHIRASFPGLKYRGSVELIISIILPLSQIIVSTDCLHLLGCTGQLGRTDPGASDKTRISWKNDLPGFSLVLYRQLLFLNLKDRFLLSFSHMHSYLGQISAPDCLNKMLMHENVRSVEGAEHLSDNWVYGLVPVAKPKDRMCQRMDHKEGTFKGELREGKNANPA